MHTDVDEDKAIEYRRPRWWIARDKVELAAPHVDGDKGDDDGHDPIHGRQRECGDGYGEEPLP